MTDIVKRLRTSIRVGAYHGSPYERGICGRQMTEAADEIERLRASERSAWNAAVERDEQIERLTAELAEAKETLQFVERWANHHGAKPTCSAEAALSCIQHYPPIIAITRGYADGQVPDTPNPWAEVAALRKDAEPLRAYRVLKLAVEAMMAPLGYHGTISARDDRVQSVMDALAQIDEADQ